MEENDIDPTH